MILILALVQCSITWYSLAWLHQSKLEMVCLLQENKQIQEAIKQEITVNQMNGNLTLVCLDQLKAASTSVERARDTLVLKGSFVNKELAFVEDLINLRLTEEARLHEIRTELSRLSRLLDEERNFILPRFCPEDTGKPNGCPARNPDQSPYLRRLRMLAETDD